MIYVVDNGLSYSSHALRFVEAPEDFGTWFTETLVPWLDLHDLLGGGQKIVGSCSTITWIEKWGMSTMSFQDFLKEHIEDETFDTNPPEIRPRYRGEKEELGSK